MPFQDELLTKLAAAISRQSPLLAAQIEAAHVVETKVWPDGSIHYELDATSCTALTSSSRWSATGSDPGLGFTLTTGRSSTELIGVVWFDLAGTRVRTVEVNAMPEDRFGHSTVAPGSLEVELAK